MMLLLVWKKTIVPMFTRETTTKAKNSTGTMLVSLARPPFPNVTGAAVTIYMMGATASMSKSAFAFLTILALPGKMNPRRDRIGLKRLAVVSRSLLVVIFAVAFRRFKRSLEPAQGSRPLAYSKIFQTCVIG